MQELLTSLVSYSSDYFGQETSEQQQDCQGEVVKSERSGNICVNKPAELGLHSWLHGLTLSVWVFIQLFAVCSLKTSRVPPQCWDALVEMPPAGLKTICFQLAHWEADSHSEREYGTAQGQYKPRTPDPEGAQPAPALACGDILAQPWGFWEIKITPSTKGEAEDALTCSMLLLLGLHQSLVGLW